MQKVHKLFFGSSQYTLTVTNQFTKHKMINDIKDPKADFFGTSVDGIAAIVIL